MRKKALLVLPMIALLAACSSTLESEDGNDLTNQTQDAQGEETQLEGGLTLNLDGSTKAEKMPAEDSTPTDPQYPDLVSVDEPVLNIPAEQDSSNYYIMDDNFNNTSITAFTTDSYPSAPEVGDLKDMGTNKYVTGWLEHFKKNYEESPAASDVQSGFLNWEDGSRGAYVSYKFAAPPMSPELTPVEGAETGVGEVRETYITEFILMRDDKVLTGTSASEKSGFPEYLQSLKF